MLIPQHMPPINPEDKLYDVTLNTDAQIYPWNLFLPDDWGIVDTVPYSMLSSIPVSALPTKTEDRIYQLYMSRGAMINHQMVMFYFRFPTPTLYPVNGQRWRISGWHVLMVDVLSHTNAIK
jgi:hypothetical protein